MPPISDLALPKRNSRLAVASTVIGLGLPLVVVLLVGLLFFVDSKGVQHSLGRDSSKTLTSVVGGTMLIVGLLALPLHLTGLIFGLVSVSAKVTNRSVAIAGIALNSVFGLIGIGMVWLILQAPWGAFR